MERAGGHLFEEAREALEDPAPAMEPARRPDSPVQFVSGPAPGLSAAQLTRLALLRKMFPAMADWPNDVLLSESVGSLSTAHGNLESRGGRDHRPYPGHKAIPQLQGSGDEGDKTARREG